MMSGLLIEIETFFWVMERSRGGVSLFSVSCALFFSLFLSLNWVIFVHLSMQAVTGTTSPCSNFIHAGCMTKFDNFLRFNSFSLTMQGTVVTTIGFLKEAPQVNIHGFNVYHKNRLILVNIFYVIYFNLAV